ncbi:MAG: 1-acyl-sn-glycerol-3-phosphate acyltransferase [Deltaproteobacteria bacterium]|nr:1-acyl-sn-glycerol-3-phosphate acyltransferase [Deltaproteobacteria bacterium]
MPQHPLPDPTDPVRRARALAQVLPVAGFLGTSLLAFNAAQLASVAVRPFSRRAFRSFGRWGADTWWGWTVRLAENLHGTHLVVTGDPIPPRESALVVANHQQMADISFLMMLARSKGRLGDMRWFVKDRLKWVPGVGWGLYLLGTFFVKRDWDADRAGIERTFASFRRDNVPLWLLLFAEGTRVTGAKLARSGEHALRRGLPPLRHVLFPRTRGFTGSVAGLRDQLDAVYDVTIGYPDGVPTLWQFMQGFADRAHFHVRRYPMAGLPAGEDELSRWLIDRFYEKDALLERFYAEGRFPG